MAEVNPKAIRVRHEQGWVKEIFQDLDRMLIRMDKARSKKEAVSLAYQGNIVDLWEKLVKEHVEIAMGSDQTSLHNPFAGGYYPAGITFEEANEMMVRQPEAFREKVHESLRRQVKAVNTMSGRGMYFWDYGNAFLLEAEPMA